MRAAQVRRFRPVERRVHREERHGRWIERRLPLPECLDRRREIRREAARHRLDSRRWIQQRLRRRACLRWRRPRLKGRRHGDHQLSPRCLWFSRLSGSPSVRQLCPARYDRRAALGAKKYRSLRWRSRERHHCRPVRRRFCRELPDGFPAGERFVSARHRRKRHSHDRGAAATQRRGRRREVCRIAGREEHSRTSRQTARSATREIQPRVP